MVFRGVDQFEKKLKYYNRKKSNFDRVKDTVLELIANLMSQELFMTI